MAKKNGTAHHLPIGVLLKLARKRKKISADAAAEGCNVSRSCWYQWEKGTYVFPKNFPAISATLGIPITRLRDANGKRRV